MGRDARKPDFIVFCLFSLVHFTSESTAMALSGWSVHPTTLFLGQARLSGQPVLRA